MAEENGVSGPRLDHVALAVTSLEEARRAYEALGFACGDVGEFPSENTREVYVETRPVRVLLQQPLSPEGPIARHIARRGDGLHHMGVVVPDLAAFLDGVAGSGWFFTSSSFKLIRMIGTAWLTRPDAGLLVHVSQARGVPEPGPAPAVERVVMASKDREATKRYLNRLAIGNVPVIPGAWHGLTCRIGDVAAAGERLRAAGMPMLTPAPVPTAEGWAWTVDGAATGGLVLELVGDPPAA